MFSIKQALRGYLDQFLEPFSQSDGLMFVLCLVALINVAHGQAPIDVNEEVLKSVMRDADSFSLKEGSPPVYRGYKGDVGSADAELVGYLFETPDYPPE